MNFPLKDEQIKYLRNKIFTLIKDMRPSFGTSYRQIWTWPANRSRLCKSFRFCFRSLFTGLQLQAARSFMSHRDRGLSISLRNAINDEREHHTTNLLVLLRNQAKITFQIRWLPKAKCLCYRSRQAQSTGSPSKLLKLSIDLSIEKQKPLSQSISFQSTVTLVATELLNTCKIKQAFAVWDFADTNDPCAFYRRCPSA